MKVSETLRLAKESLNKGNWVRGRYFSERDGNVCMCSHGAVQAQVNDRVIAILAEGPPVTISSARTAAVPPNVAAAEATAAAAGAHAAALLASEAAEATGSRVVAAMAASAAFLANIPFTPAWAAGLEAHSYLGHVGLTTIFNDLPTTELVDVFEKFEQAILLAEANGD